MLTAEQKQARLGKITSSVSAGCLGVDENKSPLDAWLEIRGEGPDDEGQPEAMLKACERGNVLEGTVLDWGAERLGLVRMPAPFRQHSEHDWLGDSADCLYFSPDDGGTEPYHVGEAKTVALGGAHNYGCEMTDKIPTHALVQSHHHLIHWPDAESCFVPVMIGGYDFSFRMYEVKRDAGFEQILLDKLGTWHHEYIVGDRPPPATYRDTDNLTRRYAQERETNALESTPQIERLAREKELASLRVKEAKQEEDTIKNTLRELLGHHELVSDSWGKVTWRSNKTSRKIDHEAMANYLLGKFTADFAEDTIKDFTREKPGARVLRVNLSKTIKKELGL